ncbi:helix-turn-helix transcriptional regulator [Streptomyces sp. NPDC048111]|uniref:helix-turn-helix transcriptional regulator n=1 Tax=Streptomyces sp. NPDC048111 TaxID=3365500 RepID=UPI00372273CF
MNDGRGRPWTFLTHHARVLMILARAPGIRIRDVAATCGITERTAQRILTDLEAAGHVCRERVGRTNRYTVDPDGSLRHPAEAGLSVGMLLALTPRREHIGGEVPPSP